MLIPQTVLRKTNPENFSSIGQILSKISFLKGQKNRFEKTSFELTVPEILRIIFQFLKIQIPLKKIPIFFYRIRFSKDCMVFMTHYTQPI